MSPEAGVAVLYDRHAKLQRAIPATHGFGPDWLGGDRR